MQVFGSHNGETVYETTLTSDEGVSVSILSLGAIVRDWTVPDARGTRRSVVLGFDDFAPYAANAKSMGIIAGRIANRVREGRFSLDGEAFQLDLNTPPDHIHGGTKGLGRQVWQMESDGRQARLSLNSPDGEMGYPGNVDFTVVIALEGHALTFEMTGVPDRRTPIALAQHSYYDVGGPVAEQTLMVQAETITEVGPRKIPTGRFVEVAGTALDFRKARAIGGTELDINFCLNNTDPAAVLTGAHYELTLETDRPGVQVYNGYDFSELPAAGHGGRRYGPFPGVALEAQDFPDAVNNSGFPSVIRSPDALYRQTTTVTIKPR